MSGPLLSSASRIRLVVAAILVAGWTASLAIYVTATPVEQDPQLADLEQTKAYQHRVEVVGGKAALESAQLQDWLESLWQGQRLAYTTAVLTAIVALVVWALARTPRREWEE
jgi:hypothetical protein